MALGEEAFDRGERGKDKQAGITEIKLKTSKRFIITLYIGLAFSSFPPSLRQGHFMYFSFFSRQGLKTKARSKKKVILTPTDLVHTVCAHHVEPVHDLFFPVQFHLLLRAGHRAVSFTFPRPRIQHSHRWHCQWWPDPRRKHDLPRRLCWAPASADVQRRSSRPVSVSLHHHLQLDRSSTCPGRPLSPRMGVRRLRYSPG